MTAPRTAGREGSSRPALNTGLLITTRAVRQILVLAVVIIAQNSLGETRYGEYATLIVLSQLASVAGDIGLQVIYTREASRERDRLGEYLAIVLGAKIPLALLAGLVLLGLMWLFTPTLLFLAIPVYLLLMATAVSNLFRAPFYVFGELRFEALAIAMETVVLLGITIHAALTHAPLAVFIWAYVASYSVTIIYAGLLSHFRYAPIRIRWDMAASGKLIRSGAPFALAVLLNTIYFKIDVVILKGMRGYYQVGSYNAAYRFIDGISFVPQAAMNAIFPRMARAFRKEGVKQVADIYQLSYRLLAGLGIPVAIGTWMLAPSIIGITRALPPATPSLRILGISIAFIFIANSFMFTLGAINSQRLFAWLMAISVVANIAFNLLLISVTRTGDGYLAASWATVITEVLLCVLGLWLIGRKLGDLNLVRLTLPLLTSGAVMAAVMFPLQGAPLLAAVLGSIAYLAAVVVTGAIRKSDIVRIRAELAPRVQP